MEQVKGEQKVQLDPVREAGRVMKWLAHDYTVWMVNAVQAPELRIVKGIVKISVYGGGVH